MSDFGDRISRIGRRVMTLRRIAEQLRDVRGSALQAGRTEVRL
jgi:hypothetical protein